jgi:hypothetical protein
VRKWLCRTVGYDAVGTTISLVIDPLVDVAGLVTSPAVKLSPNARNCVREILGERGGSVGPVGDPPHAAATADKVTTSRTLRIIRSLDHISAIWRALRYRPN